jgi:hypothetical protein
MRLANFHPLRCIIVVAVVLSFRIMPLYDFFLVLLLLKRLRTT